MVTIVIIIGLLLAFITGFFCAIKSVQLGLRWQIQAERKQEPVVNSPIAPIVNAVQQAKAEEINKYAKEQAQEWLFGKEGS